MKKYIRPAIIIVEIETSQLIAASETLSFCCKGSTVSQESDVDAAGYRSNLWDDWYSKGYYLMNDLNITVVNYYLMEGDKHWQKCLSLSF